MLLPGAGLGRLCVEMAAAGYEAQGNEFSYFMLIAAAFMLNATAVEQQWTIHPWVHLTCNNISDEDQLRPVCVPDVVPGDVVPPGLLSMCAGDFAVRRRPEAVHGTCLFASCTAAAAGIAVLLCFGVDRSQAGPIIYAALPGLCEGWPVGRWRGTSN